MYKVEILTNEYLPNQLNFYNCIDKYTYLYYFCQRMNEKSIVLTIMIMFSALWLVGCEKSPGEGGSASIRGKVLVEEHLISSQVETSYFAKDEKVFLIFGEDTEFDLDTRTSYDGSFEFEFLRTGNYRVFVYSDCSPLDSECDNSETKAVILDVSINDKNETIDLDTIIIEKW